MCPFTGDTITRSRRVDIDHLVPLKEAYLSGADTWSPEKKEAYANYLGNPNHLVAVSASANRSKGAKDPSEWMPEINQDWYIREWIRVKTEWALSYDSAEILFITNFIKASDRPRSYFYTQGE